MTIRYEMDKDIVARGIMMNKRIITNEQIEKFRTSLIEKEKSPVTVEKYIRDIRCFMEYAKGRELQKALTINYKNELIERGYAVSSVNSMLASLNGLLRFLGWEDCRVKTMKMQHRIYCAEEKELTKAEYLRLLEASKEQPRLCLVLQTICSTGIRISELSYFTVESVKRGEIRVSCKNKTRTILIPGKLRKMLLSFAKKKGIFEGIIFQTKNGNPLNRSNVWTEMKKLCEKAKVNSTKVFPHNLRKLFARTFYEDEKDIAKLADILGHSSIDTTRIYIMSTGKEHREKIERLGLVIEIKKMLHNSNYVVKKYRAYNSKIH